MKDQSIKNKRISFIFNLLILLQFSIMIIFILFVKDNSIRNFNYTIEKVFSDISDLGSIVYNYLTSNNLINLDFIYTKYYFPFISVQVLYIVLPFLLVQAIVLVLFKRLSSNKSIFNSAIISFVLLVSILIFQNTSLDILRYSIVQPYNTLKSILNITIILQIVFLILALITNNKLDTKDFFTHINAKKLAKIMSISTLVLYLSLYAGYSYLNTQTNNLKDTLKIDYVLDLNKVKNNKLALDIPTDISSKLDKIGISLPTHINTNDLIKQTNIKKIDFGKPYNTYVFNKIDTLKYDYISIPLFKLLGSIVLVSLIVFIEFYAYRFNSITSILYYSQFILSSFLLLYVAKDFGLFSIILITSIFITSCIHTFLYIKDSKLFSSSKPKNKGFSININISYNKNN